MAVSSGYLTKVRRAVRRNTSTDVDAELTDIIEECRLDLTSVGVISSKATDETDYLILGAVRCYARWKFGLSNEDAEGNREDYYTLRDELRRKRDYCGYAITFTVTDGESAVVAYVTLGDETKQTNANGSVVFYYQPTGNQVYYLVESDGYISATDYIDITANATVAVELEAV